MNTAKIDIPFYLDEQHHQQIFEVGKVKAYRNWLNEKLNTSSNGICYGDTYIGKSAITIDFVQQHSGLDCRTVNQTVPIIYHNPYPRETYKWALQKIALDIFPWVSSVKLIKDSNNGNTAYWEQKVTELLSAASTRLIVIDEVSRYSQKVMAKLLEFLTSAVPQIGVVLIDYTPKIQWQFSQEPLQTKFSDRFFFPKLTASETLDLCRLWEKKTIGSHYLNWESELGQKIIFNSEGYTGTLIGILKEAYYYFTEEKAKIAIEVASNKEDLEQDETLLQSWEEYEAERKLIEKTRHQVSFNGETDIPSLTKALLLKSSEVFHGLHEPVFTNRIPQNLITELNGDVEAATIVYTIREKDEKTIVDVPQKYQPDQDDDLAEETPILIHNNENIINPDYYHETVAELGITANNIALIMNWFIPNKYTKDGLRCLDTKRAKKKLKELETKGYVAIKPNTVPNKYISNEVFQAILKRTKLNLELEL